MKRGFALLSATACLPLFAACSKVSEHSMNTSVIYGVMAVLSLLLLIGYCLLIRQKTKWFLLLFCTVSVVNFGYFLLSVSNTLTMALHANRLAYLGSVFLPLSMLMIILNTVRLHYPKWLPPTLFGISLAVFALTATQGFLPLYYEKVSLEVVNGVSVLQKQYGPLHFVYLIFLLGYFAVIICTVAHAFRLGRLHSTAQSLVLTFAVFCNIVVWLLEQLVQIDFELLSVSYIISELFLLGLYMLLQEEQKKQPVAREPFPDPAAQAYLRSQLSSLTPTERTIYNMYLEGKGSKQVMSELSITENTLKYHNKNIYSKLGVSSRKQMISLSRP